MDRLRDYGNRGLIGVLTPQANTTVEPEFWALLPPGWSMLNARLTSPKGTIEERLVDYTARFADTSDQFANAPIECVAIACTGASYLIGAKAEAARLAEVEARRGVPAVTAALAVVMALRSLGARRIALLSPYPESLTRASESYWQGHGFDVVAATGPALQSDKFHPIYAMTTGAVAEAHARLSDTDAEVVLMLGTGMATLRPLLDAAGPGRVPAISCNLALVWAATRGRDWASPDPGSLRHWMTGAHWRARLDCLFPPDSAVP